MYQLISPYIKIILFLVIIISIPIHLGAVPSSETMSNVKDVSHNLGQSINQKIATTSDGHVYLVWSDTEDFTEYSQIYFSKSNNFGKTFSNPLPISSQVGNANLPVVVATGNNVYIAWEYNSGRDSVILFKKSNDFGDTFGKILSLSNATGGARFLSLSANENNVYTVWRGTNANAPKNFEIFFRKSIDYGDTFGNILNLSNSPGDSLNPQIMVPKDRPNYLYVSWSDCIEKNDDPICNIYFAKSFDKGLSFGTPALISMITPTTHIPFTGNQQSQFLPSSLLLSVTNADTHQVVHNSVNPEITSSEDGKYVYILWEDDLTSSGLSDIFLKKSSNYGESFDDTVNLSNSLGLSRIVKSTLSGNNLYIIWADTNSTIGNFNIFFKRISDNGKILGDTQKISNSVETSVPGDLAVSDNLRNVYLVWSDSQNNQFDIFFSSSMDGGDTFSTPVNLSFTNGNSVDPLISFNPCINSTGIAWSEDVSGNYEIFYLAVT